MEILAAIENVRTFIVRAWPRIQDSIDWSEYGKLKRFDEEGNQKYQNGLLVIYSGTTLMAKQLLGEPTPEQVTAMTVVADRKIELARRSPYGYSSALRNPEEGSWAGGIKIPGLEWSLALTGLPEVGEHPILAIAMRRGRLINQPYLDRLLDPRRVEGFYGALTRVGLDEESFHCLRQRLEQVL